MTDLILLKESLESFKALPVTEAGEVLQALIRHFEGEPIGELSQMASAVFPLIKGQCERMIERRERGRINGAKGGRHKSKTEANENLNETETKPKRNLNETETKAPVPVPVPVSPIGDKRKSPSGSKEKFIPPFNSEAFQEAWDDFKHHRRRLKKPMTEYTEELTMKKLMKLSDSNEAKSIKILRQSIAEGWIGIFELKKEAKQEEPKKEHRIDYEAALIEHYIRTNGGKDEVREHQNRG